MFTFYSHIQWRNPKTGNSHYNLTELVKCDNDGNRYCTDCRNCGNCRYCIDCRNCTNCIDCRYCTDCIDCTDCNYCNYCNSQPVQLNLIPYIVTIRTNKTMKIDCKDYTITEWLDFPTNTVDLMDSQSKQFNLDYGTLIKTFINNIPESFWKAE